MPVFAASLRFLFLVAGKETRSCLATPQALSVLPLQGAKGMHEAPPLVHRVRVKGVGILRDVQRGRRDAQQRQFAGEASGW